MDLVSAVRTRVSAQRLVDPAPDHDEFVRLLELAAHAPDHGRLRPWRVILVSGANRAALGTSFAAELAATGASDAEVRRAGELPLRAPLLATLVFAPQVNRSVAEWEQLAAASGVLTSLQLLLHDRGYGSIWRTGRYATSADTRVMLDLGRGEALLGWLYVGTPDAERRTVRRPLPSVRDKVSVFRPGRCLREVRGEAAAA